MTRLPLTILIADDDSEDLELMEIAITDLDPAVVLQKANNGEAAISYLAAQPDHELPCLIILDYNMPDLTGLELLTIISNDKRYDKIPKIILSTSNAARHLKDCINNGAAEYLIKPNSTTELSDLAKKLLAYCK